MSENKDGFYGVITGTVEKVGQYAKGTYIRVAYKSNPNAQYPDRVTAWGVGTPVAEGDRVKVSGQVSVRKDERDGKTYVNTSINFPKVEAATGGAVGDSQPVSAPTATDTRSTVATPQTGAQSNWDSNDDTPF